MSRSGIDLKNLLSSSSISLSRVLLDSSPRQLWLPFRPLLFVSFHYGYASELLGMSVCLTTSLSCCNKPYSARGLIKKLHSNQCWNTSGILIVITNYFNVYYKSLSHFLLHIATEAIKITISFNRIANQSRQLLQIPTISANHDRTGGLNTVVSEKKLEQTRKEIDSMTCILKEFLFAFEVNLLDKSTNSRKSALNHPSTTKYQTREDRLILPFTDRWVTASSEYI